MIEKIYQTVPDKVISPELARSYQQKCTFLAETGTNNLYCTKLLNYILNSQYARNNKKSLFWFNPRTKEKLRVRLGTKLEDVFLYNDCVCDLTYMEPFSQEFISAKVFEMLLPHRKTVTFTTINSEELTGNYFMSSDLYYLDLGDGLITVYTIDQYYDAHYEEIKTESYVQIASESLSLLESIKLPDWVGEEITNPNLIHYH